MTKNIFMTASALSDGELLARIGTLAATEREAAAELVGHLAVLELRPALYEAQGYGSLFDYCTGALALSEDVACNRIDVARASRRFPALLEMIAAGALSLSGARRLCAHLTIENEAAVLARAAHRSLREIETLVVELAPKPDVATSVRKLPARGGVGSTAGDGTSCASSLFGASDAAADQRRDVSAGAASDDAPPVAAGGGDVSDPAGRSADGDGGGVLARCLPAAMLRPTDRSIVQPLAPQRYRVQFTIGESDRVKLSRLQALLCREVPKGDPASIYSLALDALLEKVEKAKLGKRVTKGTTRQTSGTEPDRAETGATEPGGTQTGGTVASGRVTSGTERPIRRATDNRSASSQSHSLPQPRHVPNPVKRAVWFRDGGQCAFVSEGGLRCTQRRFLELHHIQPYALDGPATAGNIALRCRRHNAYEAEVVFGARARREKSGT